MAWVSPTAFIDESNLWSNEGNIYDEDTASAALSTVIAPETWQTDWLVLSRAAISCDKVRFWASNGTYSMQINLEAWKDGAWVPVFVGVYAHSEWVEKTFAQGSVEAARVKFYNDDAVNDRLVAFYEFDFWEVVAPPVAAAYGFVV